MIRISKKEVEYLLKNGCSFGNEIHVTHSRWRHYFLTEGTRCMTILNNYRESLKN